MPLSTLRRLWLGAGAISLLLALDVMVSTQGWPVLEIEILGVVGVRIPEGSPEAVSAYWGVIFLTPVLLVTWWLAFLHAREARRIGEPRWPAGLFDMGAQTSPARAWRVFTALMFGVFPTYTLGHAWRNVTDRIVLCVEGGVGWHPAAQGWDALWYWPETSGLARIFTSKGLRLSEMCSETGMEAAISAYPILFPTILMVGTIGVAALAGRTVWEILREDG